MDNIKKESSWRVNVSRTNKKRGGVTNPPIFHQNNVASKQQCSDRCDATCDKQIIKNQDTAVYSGFYTKWEYFNLTSKQDSWEKWTMDNAVSYYTDRQEK